MENWKQSNRQNREIATAEKKNKIGAPFPVHIQVRKIKEESETVIDWRPGQPEIRPPSAAAAAFRDVNRPVSRSPLGISGRPISVGEL